MESTNGFRTTQSADGPATILAIGTANPSNVIDQSAYPDFYFRVTNSEHLQDLKAKFRRICMTRSYSRVHPFFVSLPSESSYLSCLFMCVSE